jgi:clathrin heavy chain
MARKTLREVPVDTALAFCFARTNQLPELEEFLRGTNVADVEASGDKAYEEGYHEAAKIFFSSISNWAKLATTLVHLEDYQAAVECARKANSVKVWRQVNEACIAKKEFRLAQICGLNLIVHAEELAELVKQYERNGYFDELISLLEAGLGLERGKQFSFPSPLTSLYDFRILYTLFPCTPLYNFRTSDEQLLTCYSTHGTVHCPGRCSCQVPSRARYGTSAFVLV